MMVIADDDAGFAENCAMVLRTRGDEVSVVPGGREAPGKIESQQPELLFPIAAWRCWRT